MLKRLRDALQIRRGEVTVTTLMFFYIFGVLTFYYILKPLRSGLFLSNFPSSHLPYAYFLTAFMAGSLATLFFKLSRRVSAIAFIVGTNLLIIATLVYFRWAMGREIFYLPYVYYVYVQLVSVVSTTQFWLLAGYIYDNTQSKRIFPLLGAGAIVGATAGSAIPGYLSSLLSIPAMLLLCIGVCVLLILIGLACWRFRRPDSGQIAQTRRFEEPRERMADMLRVIFGSRHLALIALLIFLTLIASQIVDWQFEDALQDTYEHLPKEQMKNSINELRGRFYNAVNILGFIVQLTMTGFVVRRFGISAAVLLLPAALLLTSGGVFLLPALWTTVLALGSNSVFRYSINRVGLELLYLPLSPENRKRIKAFLDVFVDRLGRAVAGIIILAFTSAWLPLGLRGTAVAVMALCALCIAVGYWLRRSYAEAFREKLARREVDLEEVNRYVSDPASVRLLVDALETAQERQILYALRLLQSVRGVDFSRQLLPLLEHPSPLVREQAARTLPALPEPHRPQATRLLKDPQEGVRVAAVEYLCATGVMAAELQRYLDDEDIRIQLAAARCAAAHDANEYRPDLQTVQRLLAVSGEHAVSSRTAAALLAGRLETQDSIAILQRLLKDPEQEVAATAAQAAGQAGHLELVFAVLPMLGSRGMRKAAREALLRYGMRIIGTLGDVLGDASQPLSLRREIPWVLARLPHTRSAEVLVACLDAADPLLKYRVVKALNRLHETNPELPPPHPALAERVFAETRAYYEVLVLRSSLTGDRDDAGSSLLVRALRERLEQNLEIIFRLLGLQYPQKDIYFAYGALKGSQSDRRASAIEFLDNLLQKNLKSLILPLLEETSADRLVEQATRLFGLQTRRPEEALRLVLEQPDVWLKACALQEVGQRRLREFEPICRDLSRHQEPLIRETAEWALRQCA